PLENPNAVNMVREIRSVFRMLTAKEGGRAEVVRDRVANKAYMQVICPRFQLPYIREAVKALDQPWIKENNDGYSTVYYRAKNRDISIVNALAHLWCDGEGISQIDASNNAVVRREEPTRAVSFVKYCDTVDVVPDQMVFEGAIYEVNANDDFKLGLDYIAWKNGPGRSLFECIRGRTRTDQEWDDVSSIWDPLTGKRYIEAPLTPADHDQETRASQKYCSFNYVVNSAYLDFLASKGKARVIVRPKIITRSNVKGTFSTVEQILSFNVVPDVVTRTPYNPPATPAVAGDAGELGVDNRTVNYSIYGTTAATTTGLTLEVTPWIGSESTEVQVAVSYRTLSGVTPQGIPMINTRALTTRARVRDGEPLVIAGLDREEKVDAYAGIPFLSSIPGFGLVFGGETHSIRKTQLVIVLVPRLITGTSKELATAEEVETMKMALGEQRFEIPTNPWGFDQWLLDQSKTAPY
ncbi:MAG TPA: hypothetical protein P5532_25455, partial [Planctomycetota bacterium]|nr:hypothetical protein [Planctomycetota bacterium]